MVLPGTFARIFLASSTPASSAAGRRCKTVVRNVGLRLCMVGIVTLPNALHLQVQKEALNHGVIPTISFSAHAANEPMARQQCAALGAGVLAAAV